MSKQLYPRYVESLIREALREARVVFLYGPRQAGKTTLVRQFAGNRVPYFTLDDDAILRAVSADPVGFVRDLDFAVIDEVQREPRLVRAIKQSVDEDLRPGRFLLTGSANLMTLPRVADDLVGRVEPVVLLPLSQAELRGRRSTFLESVFAGKAPRDSDPTVGKALLEIIFEGGYPEALSRASLRSRRNWCTSYVATIMQRDMRTVARLDQIGVMPSLLQVLAHFSGQLVNFERLSSAIHLSRPTTGKYVAVLDNLFLVSLLQPWFTNTLKRIVKRPNVQFLDSGLLAVLRKLSPDAIRRDRTLLGPLLESFIYGELRKLMSWGSSAYTITYFRDHHGHEVDFVIEDGDGRIVGIEVKAAATVGRQDFRGLRQLAKLCGERLVLGVVLYDHDLTLPFGDRMVAAPVSTLWS